MSSNMQIPKVCLCCGKHFLAKTTVTKYCSHKCNSRHYKARKRSEKTQKAFQDFQEELKPGKVKFSLEKEYLSVTEVAELLGVSRWTIQRMVKNGRVSSAKIGRKRLIKRRDLDNLFQ